MLRSGRARSALERALLVPPKLLSVAGRLQRQRRVIPQPRAQRVCERRPGLRLMTFCALTGRDTISPKRSVRSVGGSAASGDGTNIPKAHRQHFLIVLACRAVASQRRPVLVLVIVLDPLLNHRLPFGLLSICLMIRLLADFIYERGRFAKLQFTSSEKFRFTWPAFINLRCSCGCIRSAVDAFFFVLFCRRVVCG